MEIEEKYIAIEEIGKNNEFETKELILLGEKGDVLFYIHKIFTAKFFKNSSDTTEKIIPAGGWFIVPRKFLPRFIFEERILCPYLLGLDREEEYYPHAFLKQEFPVGCIDFNGHSAAVIIEKRELCIKAEDAKKIEKGQPHTRKKNIDPEKSSTAALSILWKIIQRTHKEGKIPPISVGADLASFFDSLEIKNLSGSNVVSEKIEAGNKEIKPHLEKIKNEIDEIFSSPLSKTAK